MSFVLENFEVVNKLIIKHLSGYQPLLIRKAKAKTLWVERQNIVKSAT